MKQNMFEEAINVLGNRFKADLTKADIIDRLSKFGFNGVAILSDSDFIEDFELEQTNGTTLGIYSREDKTIYITDSYKNDLSVYIHELCHAIMYAGGLVDNDFYFETYGDEYHSIGYAVSEGICSGIAEQYGNNNTYPMAVGVIMQLNELYKMNDQKKCQDLFSHVLKYPNETFSIIYNTYKDILDRNNIMDSDCIALRSAYTILSCCDCFTDGKKDGNLFGFCESINYRYFCLEDHDVLENGLGKYENLFSDMMNDASKREISAENKLLKCIFGEKSYNEREVLKKVSEINDFNSEYINYIDNDFKLLKKDNK